MKNALALLLAALALSGCAHKKHVKLAPQPAPPGPSGAPTGAAPGADYVEAGIASWYGYPYHGRPAANGEIYDMEKMVAAHRTLPFETWVRVHDLDTGKDVEVRIIDRGPFVDGRIIDLSHAAARAIDMIGPGTANVRLEVISRPVGIAPPAFAVQVGAFRDRATAERLRTQMAALYGTAQLLERVENPGVWRVAVGNWPTADAAKARVSEIRRESGEKKSFVIRLDSK